MHSPAGPRCRQVHACVHAYRSLHANFLAEGLLEDSRSKAKTVGVLKGTELLLLSIAGWQVLQDSLCGSSKVLLVTNLAPEAASAAETLSSLSFAARAAKARPGAGYMHT